MEGKHPDTGDFQYLETVIGSESVAETPKRIGHYRILQKLGEGGMGVVYEADQTAPVRRRVALKVIKSGMDTVQVVRRFESERQALALMSHPAIARVYDAGATEDGRPFFAMEYVQGAPITDFCHRHRLDLEQRLELFVRVCEGVQHAHQKGIIHRDIKPTNVLVREEDGRYVPKIIDFGIAKATAQRLTDKTFFTEMGQLIGTPEYMSPEQAEMVGVDIDTRTDVYLLGVLLYELLTGELPFDSRELKEKGFDEFRRKVMEVEPKRPSTRLTSSGPSVVGRGKTPAGLPRQLKGDLDWITMKALEKDPARRYASVSELAQDVERHLHCQPVTAGPPSNFYKVQKFCRRHKTGVGFAAVLVLLLAGFAAMMAVQSRRLRVEAATSRVTSEFLVDLFRHADPNKNPGGTVTARALLEEGQTRIHELDVDTAVRARLLHAMGQAFSGIGSQDRARFVLESALENAEEQFGADSLEAAAISYDLVSPVMHSDLSRAYSLARKTLETRRRRLGPEHRLVVNSLQQLGNLAGIRGAHEEAARLHRQVFEIRERQSGPDDPALAAPLSNLAIELEKQGQLVEAERYLVRALRLLEREYGTFHHETARRHELLGRLYELMGDAGRAHEHHEQCLTILRTLYQGEPNMTLASSILNLAIAKAMKGEDDAAAELHGEAIEMLRETGALESAFHSMRLAHYAALTGERERAIDHLRACVERGYRGTRPLGDEPHFESLRDDLRFQELVIRVERRAASF